MKCSILFLILAVFWSAPMLTAQEKMGDPEKLGKVHFPVSCTSAAQQQFDRAMAMLHSFWVSPAANAFAEVAKSDPDCAMAYWGIAINRRTNPLAGAPDAAALKDGWEAVEKAKSIGPKDGTRTGLCSGDWELLQRLGQGRPPDTGPGLRKVYGTGLRSLS